MSEQGEVMDLLQSESDYRDYEKSERRRSLFRVLASNLVRELRSAGHHGSDLVGFVSQLMQAVTDEGFTEAGSEARAPHPVADLAHALGSDEHGRPCLTGSRVILRMPRESDRSAFEEWQSDPLVQASFAPALLERLIRQASGEQQPDRLDFVVCDRESTSAFGAVSLFNIDTGSRQAELAKTIGDPRFRGRGLAVDATSLLLAYGFGTLGLNRVYLRTLGGNLNNIKLNERIGFRFEGVLREAVHRDGKPADVVLMALLRNEFERSGAVDEHGDRTSVAAPVE